MKMLSEKLSEERQKFREQMESELRAQREQMNNMMEANMKQAQQDRKLFMHENQELKNQFLANQNTNEDNMKMIEKLSDLVSKQEEEKRHLGEQMEKALQRIEAREKEKATQGESEVQKLLRRMEAQNMEMARQAEIKWQGSLQWMEARHREEKEKLRSEMVAKIEAQRIALTQENRKAAEARMGVMCDMQKKIKHVEDQLKGWVFPKVKRGCPVM